MDNCINEYKLKSSVCNILHHHPEFINCTASVNHDDVIAVLWTWVHHYYGKRILTPAADIASLKELMRQKLSRPSMNDLVTAEGYHVCRIKLPNTTWYIKDMNHGALYHHERYDGKGYPKGLKGEEIPLIARMICVADSLDAMNSNRCYRPKLTKEVIIEELEKNKGKQFDPEIVEHILKLIKQGVINIGE